MKPLVLSALLSAMAGSHAFSQSIAPSVINATGGSYTKGYYILDWSVGEQPLVNKMESSNSSLIVTNGFLQPYVHDLSDPRWENLFTYDEVRILPNPTYGVVEVNFLTKQKGKVQLRLFDRMGQLRYSKNIPVYGYGLFERINMTGFVNGAYLLKVELIPDPGFVRKVGAYTIIKVGH